MTSRPGRPRKGHSLADALREEAERKTGTPSLTGRQRLAVVAWQRALAGEYQWANLLFERLDGKVNQKIDLAETVRSMAEREGLDPALLQAEVDRILAGE